MAAKDQAGILMYSTTWCPDCMRAKYVLKRLKIPFTEIDIEKDEGAYQLVVEFNQGKRIVPTIFFPDGSVLVEPSNSELIAKVAALGLGAEAK